MLVKTKIEKIILNNQPKIVWGVGEGGKRYANPTLVKELEALFNSNLKEEREGIIREVEGLKKPSIDYSKPENKYSEFPKSSVGFNEAIDKVLEKLGGEE